MVMMLQSIPARGGRLRHRRAEKWRRRRGRKGVTLWDGRVHMETRKKEGAPMALCQCRERERGRERERDGGKVGARW
jgi:hypothetical protein